MKSKHYMAKIPLEKSPIMLDFEESEKINNKEDKGIGSEKNERTKV